MTLEDIKKNKLISLLHLNEERILNIILSFIILFLIGYSFFIHYQKQNINLNKFTSNNTSTAKSSNNQLYSSKKIFVDIEGQVVNPGVYEIEENKRIADLIILSGGFTQKVDYAFISQKLNKADKLKDGQKIYIPAENELVLDTSSINSETSSINLDSTNTFESSSKININSAPKDKLEELTGIGSVSAESIINARPYSSIEELLSKKILTSARYEKIKDQIEI